MDEEKVERLECAEQRQFGPQSKVGRHFRFRPGAFFALSLSLSLQLASYCNLCNCFQRQVGLAKEQAKVFSFFLFTFERDART